MTGKQAHEERAEKTKTGMHEKREMQREKEECMRRRPGGKGRKGGREAGDGTKRKMQEAGRN